MARGKVEPLRREALVEAAIAEVAASGASDVTVAAIARRAGVSAALAHHYFGSKDRILLAAMRHILTVYGAAVRGALAMADGPEARLEAILRASFGPENFRADVIAAWLDFYVLARRDEGAGRLLRVYRRRLRSNLVHALRPLVADPWAGADSLGALIDGLYLRAALGSDVDPLAVARAHLAGLR